MLTPVTLELNRLKVGSAVWLHNYRQFRRPEYLTHAMAATRQALALYRQLKTKESKNV